MEIIDDFVYAHNYHRHNMDNLGKIDDCMEGRIRVVTAITPSYAQAYQVLCLTTRPTDIPYQRFRMPSAKAKYPNLPNIRTTTRKKGDDFKGCAVFTDGRTHATDGETPAGWGAVARSPNMRPTCVWERLSHARAYLWA